jgi:MFS family permease
MTDLLRRLEPWSPLALLVLPVLWSITVFDPAFHPDIDSYFHVACADLYAHQGWISTFPWMPQTVLGVHWNDVHLLMHLLTAPLLWLFPAVFALKLAGVLWSAAIAGSAFLVLRRAGVRWAGAWVTLGFLASQLFLTLSLSPRGASAFYVILLWFLDALRTGAVRRILVLSWLSVYAYVGAPILVPLALVSLLVHHLWDGGWGWRPLGAVLLGLLGGMVVNPYWPAHWIHLYEELANAFVRPPYLDPGGFFGAEWLSLVGRDVIRFSGVFLGAWFLLIMGQLREERRLSATTTTLAVSSLGLLGASLLAAKFFYLFYLLSIVALPLVAAESRAWSRPLLGLAVVAGVVVGGLNFSISNRDMHENGKPSPAEFQAMAEFLAEKTPEGMTVVAPWNDFPGLFFFNRQNHYVVGLNTNFLLRQDERRFVAYYMLYSGRVTDPENLVPDFFDGSRVLLVRQRETTSGDRKLTKLLKANQNLLEVAPTPSAPWRVFVVKARSRATPGAAPAPQAAPPAPAPAS